MQTSISEIKTFNECRRKWFFSGRNGLHLRPLEQKQALFLGSAFHDVLENFYSYKDINFEDLQEKYGLSDEDLKLVTFQTNKYKDNVLKNDLETFNIIEPELKYNFPLVDDVNLFGFIDVVYEEKKTGKFGILEHKFVKNFRSDTYNQLDEQIKAYEMVINHFYGQCDAGVNLNQVRKLKTTFSHARDNYKCNKNQMDYFRSQLEDAAREMSMLHDLKFTNYDPSPHWIGCGFCEYKDLCLKMNTEGTNDTTIITDNDILKASLRSLKEI